jgi:hypothetical protein
MTDTSGKRFANRWGASEMLVFRHGLVEVLALLGAFLN